MKELITLISILFIAAHGIFAQSNTNITYFAESKKEDVPVKKKFYIGVGTGLNNNVGILGITGEYNLYKNFSAYAGGGIGTWGYKLNAGLKLYLNYPYSSAFVISYTYVTGVSNVKSSLEVQNPNNGQISKQDVTFNAKPANLINISWQRHWRISDVVRFNMELGYSINLNSNFNKNYEITSKNTYPLSRNSETVMRLIQPGGIIIGVGFTFGLE